MLHLCNVNTLIFFIFSFYIGFACSLCLAFLFEHSTNSGSRSTKQPLQKQSLGKGFLNVTDAAVLVLLS